MERTDFFCHPLELYRYVVTNIKYQNAANTELINSQPNPQPMYRLQADHTKQFP